MVCYYAEFYHAECPILFIIMLIVVILSVIMLSIVVPGKLSTVDLLVKIAFLQNGKNIFNIKISLSELVSTRRSTVLSFPFGKDSLVGHSFTLDA
jgi:hypothetical protein